MERKRQRVGNGGENQTEIRHSVLLISKSADIKGNDPSSFVHHGRNASARRSRGGLMDKEGHSTGLIGDQV